MNKQPTPSSKFSQDELYNLSCQVMRHFDRFIEFFRLDLHKDARKYYGCCPIHGGDNQSALNIYHEGPYYGGNWQCRTHQCHNHFAKWSIIGFIRGVLSNKKYDWCGPQSRSASLTETLQVVRQILGKEYKTLSSLNSQDTEQQRISNTLQALSPATTHNIGPKRQEVLKHLTHVPAQYYLQRGYQRNTLMKYDVGFCDNPNKPFYKRAVIPVYDTTYTYMIGCTGRSIFKQCPKCQSWHSPTTQCPNKEKRHYYSKWKHSSAFRAEEHLYNYWFAKELIQQSQTAILVESPGNVWRLAEAGVENVVGLFGTSLTYKQQRILDTSGALKLIIIFDNDGHQAGLKGARLIEEQCQMLYYTHVLMPPSKYNDIGDMSIANIQHELLPSINKLTGTL